MWNQQETGGRGEEGPGKDLSQSKESQRKKEREWGNLEVLVYNVK